MRAFLAIDTQWRMAMGPKGQAVWVGLDYGAVRGGFDLAGIAMTPELWSDVQLIENGALSALNRAET